MHRLWKERAQGNDESCGNDLSTSKEGNVSIAQLQEEVRVLKKQIEEVRLPIMESL